MIEKNLELTQEKNLPQFLTYEDLSEYSGTQIKSISGFFSRNKIVGEPFRGNNNRPSIKPRLFEEGLFFIFNRKCLRN